MNVSKNPLYKRRTQIDTYARLMEVNSEHLMRLVYTLSESYSFYPKRVKEFLDRYIENVEYVQADGDNEVRRYRFNELLRDAPYVSYSRADIILSCMESFASERNRPIYVNRKFRGDLIDNIILALLTLHYDFGFGESRIARVSVEWSQCGIADPVAWAENRYDISLSGTPASEVNRWLEDTSVKPVRTTLREQKEAAAHLDALRRYQREVLEDAASEEFLLRQA